MLSQRLSNSKGRFFFSKSYSFIRKHNDNVIFDNLYWKMYIFPSRIYLTEISKSTLVTILYFYIRNVRLNTKQNDLVVKTGIQFDLG